VKAALAREWVFAARGHSSPPLLWSPPGRMHSRAPPGNPLALPRIQLQQELCNFMAGGEAQRSPTRAARQVQHSDTPNARSASPLGCCEHSISSAKYLSSMKCVRGGQSSAFKRHRLHAFPPRRPHKAPSDHAQLFLGKLSRH
jgi:hypothetical protein